MATHRAAELQHAAKVLAGCARRMGIKLADGPVAEPGLGADWAALPEAA
jgi:hypothetical protein